MQQDVAHAVAAIETISHVIGEINDYQTAIASAVEEQTATTGEMARSVSRTADEGRTAADSATTLSSSAQGTLGQVARVTEVSERMLEVAGQLRSFVAEYQR